ncbi:MAG: hypothetical protein P4M00_03850 [Azospirillaceae bacterium]|nr:hypothetical protein [Azospirillaceae bacterium]
MKKNSRIPGVPRLSATVFGLAEGDGAQALLHVMVNGKAPHASTRRGGEMTVLATETQRRRIRVNPTDPDRMAAGRTSDRDLVEKDARAARSIDLS